MQANWKSDYAKEKDRRERTARKIAQEHNRTSDDELMEQCVIAYAAHIADCGCIGHKRWAEFRPDWFKAKGIMEDNRNGR
jgi:hypothetical protein